MLITLLPMRHDDTLTVGVTQSTLTLNGAVVDLTTYEAGANPWIVGLPDQVAGIWQVTLILPYGPVPDATDPAAQAVLFPAPIRVTQDGPVPLPAMPPPAGDIGGDGT